MEPAPRIDQRGTGTEGFLYRPTTTVVLQLWVKQFMTESDNRVVGRALQSAPFEGFIARK